MLPASRYATIDEHLIPVDVVGVDGTPFDFRQATRIDARIRRADPLLARAHGYDHHWILDPHTSGLPPDLRLAARLGPGELYTSTSTYRFGIARG